MRIRPREVQAEDAHVAGRTREDAAGLLKLSVAVMFAVLFIAAAPAWTQEATNTPGTEGTPDLSEETGEDTVEVPRDRYDEKPGERTVAEVTKTGTSASESSIPSSPEAKPDLEATVEPVAEPAAEPTAAPKAEPLPKLPAPQAPKGQAPVLPETGGVDLLSLFLGASCLVVGALALVMGRGGRPGARPVDRPPEGR